MIRIKALNDHSESSDFSDDSEYQVTREAEEEELNELYMNALKYATEGDRNEATKLLEQLKCELEIDGSKVKDAFLLKRLKYLTYKNLGLLKDDLNFILDALEIDDSDINLWITAGRKSREKFNYLLSKYCFEIGYNFNNSNYAVIDNLIDLYFITNHLYRCVSICFRALELDPHFLKAKIMINECIRLMPSILKDINPECICHISSRFGGQDYRLFEDEEFISYTQEILNSLNQLKLQYYRGSSHDNDYNKRKQLTLNLNSIEHSTFEKIGLKIKSIYDLIQKNHFNISTPIHINFVDQVDTTSSTDNKHDLNHSSNHEIKNENEDSSILDEKLKKSSNEFGKEQKLNEKLLLYEYSDKRRSSRVKTKSKNSDFDDDQNVFDCLLNLLPEKLRNENTKSVNIDTEYLSSNSASINDNEFSLEAKTIETEAIDRFFQKLKSNSNKHMNIFEIIAFFLTETCLIENLVIPRIFLTLYKIYRDQNQLPCGTLCQIGKDITTDLIFVCLTANEIEYQKQETLFLKQILFKLYFHLEVEVYRKFLIRFFVLCGSKELNTDFLHYALDCCQPDSQYFKYFKISNEKEKNMTVVHPYEVMASNKLKINTQYINTLIDMQNVSISKLSNDQNYSEIIRLCFTKSERDLTTNEKRQLYEAIVKAELWQKGIDFFENWSHFSEECLQTILQCVMGKKARLTPKLARKIIKRAAECNSIIPWIIFYWCFVSEDVPTSSLIKFFTLGHSILGKRGLCTDYEGEFLLRAQKVFVENDLENEALMCFSCLFNFPPRKSLQIQDCHTSSHIDLKWSHCSDIYEYFAPEQMPEFDSHARQSGITLETKEFFIKILNLIPETEKPRYTQAITNYIKRGNVLSFPENVEINPITSSLYYLLADHNFKAKDFAKAKYFYINDLSLNVNRFDSWAGLALSINYQLDQMLIEGSNTNSEKFHQTAFSTMQCFEKALQLQPDNSKLWIEYGILCYNVASNWSRLMKRIQIFGESYNNNETTNTFYKYEDVLQKAKHCFERVNDKDIYNEESWLSYYMLGKVSEKSKSDLLTILQCYEWAYLNLYLDGAAYPKKISYYNPPYLSIEALEIHYRIHSCVLKYLLNNRKFTARMLRQLKFHLIKVNKSPFVLRKIYNGNKKQNGSKNSVDQLAEDEQQIFDLIGDVISLVADREIKFDVNRARNELITMCINGIKKCLSRYSAHYKSYYRLAHYYSTIQDNFTAKSILCGGQQNKMNLLLRFETDPEKPNSNPGYINGLFVERKPSNLYNGIWRIPVDEIERAGNFNFHMFRCTNLLIAICGLTEDYHQLSSIAVQLYKTPEQDKKYVSNVERMMLSKKAFDKCFNILESKIIISKNVLINVEQVIEEIQIVAQNMIKHNVFPSETIQKCNFINEHLLANQRMS